MTRSGGALALTFALSFLAPAVAQEADPEDSRARARTLVEAFEGYDEALAGSNRSSSMALNPSERYSRNCMS